MVKPVLKIKLLHKDAKLPTYAHPGDAGFDLFATETIRLAPGETHLFKLGIVSEIPRGWYVALRDRSSLASKHSLHNLAGTIDAGYRGEWGIIMVNLGKKPVRIEKGDRIGQGILLPAVWAEIAETDELSETKRGRGGFGSTGQK